MITFEELFSSFKKMDFADKEQAIIDFLKQDIVSMQTLNNEINNDLDSSDINKIVNENLEDKLDVIYQLLHVMTEQVEIFTEKVSNEFYE